MTIIHASGTLSIGGAELEYRMIGPAPSDAPTIVMLHEGLGSVGLWGDFPEKLQAATGAGVFVYSRIGYGQSSPVTLPRHPDYMHVEALDVLPKILDAIGFKRGLLFGHSDGASISAIYAGAIQDRRVCGLVLIAPHFFVEDITLNSIAQVHASYKTTDLKAKFARWHKDPDNMFLGWTEGWLDPRFHQWDITDSLASIRPPILVIQGENDNFGTLRQIEIVQQECKCPVEVAILPGIGHAPHREAPDATLNVTADMANRVLKFQDEGVSSSAE